MLKIYDQQTDVPDEMKEHYHKRADGKFEPSVEGITSIGGLLNKRDELLTKVADIPNLKTRILELEGQDTLPQGKIAVDKKDFDALETYKALGDVNDIKPKVEGYDALKTETEGARKREILTRAASAAGVTNLNAFFNIKQTDALSLESETVDGREKFFAVSKDDKGKVTKTAFDNDYLTTADGFKDVLGSLTAGEGKKMFRQSTGGGGESKAERIRNEVKEKEAARGNVTRSFAEAFSGTNPA